MTRRNYYRSLNVEPLESRLVLAGNVMATLSGSTLKLTGDDFANAIVVTQLNATTLRVQGVNDGAAVATAINGVANGTQDFNFGANFANAGLKISMKSGDDSVTVGVLPGTVTNVKALTIDVGAGADTVNILNTNVNGTSTAKLTLGTNSQNEVDRLTLSKTLVAGNLDIRTGAGNDVIDGGSLADPLTVTKKLGVDAGAGDDTVDLEGSAGSFSARLGDGNDTTHIGKLGAFTVNGASGTTKVDAGDGDDTLNFTGFNARNSMDIRLGNGTNTLGANGLISDKSLKISGGSGNDNIGGNGFHGTSITVKLSNGNDGMTVSNLDAKTAADRTNLTIDAGTGDDTFNLTTVKADKFSVRLGTGLNQLTVGGASDANDLRFYGGADKDTVAVNGTTTLDWLAYFYGGDDMLSVNTVTVTNLLKLDGGPGTNALNETAFTKPFGATTIVNFVV